MFWYLKKTTNTAEIFGSVSSILKHEKIENITYNSKLYECFSRKKLDIFEDETYRIERKELEDLVYGSFKHIENIDYPDMKNIKFVNFFGRGMNMTGYYTDGSNFYVNPYEGGSEKVIMLQKFVPKK